MRKSIKLLSVFFLSLFFLFTSCEKNDSKTNENSEICCENGDGMRIAMQEDGFFEVFVPDVMDVMQKVIKENLDIDDVLYTSKAGPILVRDVLYGYHVEIERSGNDFFAHKTGFSPKSLERNLALSGFHLIIKVTRGATLEIGRVAFRSKPNEDQQK